MLKKKKKAFLTWLKTVVSLLYLLQSLFSYPASIWEVFPLKQDRETSFGIPWINGSMLSNGHSNILSSKSYAFITK